MSDMQPPKGTRDFLPDEMEKRNYVFDTIRSIYKKYGFREMETPAFENLEVLTKKSGEAIKDEIYTFKDKADRDLGLRFDLTVPMARVVGSNPSLTKPFKRFAIGRVFRYDNPSSLRWREFWQADVDIIGVKGVVAEVECIAAVTEALAKLGLANFTVKVNSRKMVQGYLESIGVKNMDEAFRIIDKLDKVGLEGVSRELREKGFSESEIGYIKGYLESNVANIENPLFQEGAQELANFEKVSREYGLNVKFDKSLVRGLGYYTGLVFEIGVEGISGSVGGGGRYDNLIGIYGQDLPAVGMSIGVDRVIEILKEKNILKDVRENVVYVISIKDEVRGEAAKLVRELRQSGIPADYDISERKLGKQLEYANSTGVKYTIIIGPQEVEKNVVNLKNMVSGEEKQVPRQLLLQILK